MVSCLWTSFSSDSSIELLEKLVNECAEAVERIGCARSSLYIDSLSTRARYSRTVSSTTNRKKGDSSIARATLPAYVTYTLIIELD